MRSAPRKRAAEVCQNCHRRKVRCDVYYAGPPCTKCSTNGEACESRSRKSYAPRKSKTSAMRGEDEPQDLIGASAGEITGAESSTCTDAEDSRDQVVANAISSSEPLLPNAETVPLFVGDHQGIGALLVATDSESAKNNQRRHLMIPRTAAKSLQPEDLEYLKAKGCFSLPTADICDALIESYFRFVHPLLPIIGGQEFLGRYEKYGVQQVNLLLLWSMFSVSAGYIEDNILKRSGYDSHKSFKEDAVKRAKLLFDLSCENDKIILISSALLLSHWFVDAEDVKQSWYWTGIAISISQTIGLHRNPDAKRRNSALNDQQRRSWRNIWWSCLLRDSWLAFGMGRPARINLKDCDCPTPTASDAELNVRDIIINGKDVYTPDTASFASLWLDLLKVSAALNKLLGVRYRSHRGQPTSSNISALRNEVAPIFEVAETSSSSNITLTIAIRHLHLHQRAAQIALFRPDTDSHAIEKVQDAAGAINNILERSMADGSAIYTAPSTLALIVPAMITHLKAARSSIPLTRQLGAHKLELCLMFLKTLQNNYPAAGIIHRLFVAIKETKKENEEVAVGRNDHQSLFNDYLPATTDNSDIDTPSQQSTYGYSSSEFALLPMAGQIFDLTAMDSTDPNFSSMNFELDATQNIIGSELINGFSGSMDPYTSLS